MEKLAKRRIGANSIANSIAKGKGKTAAKATGSAAVSATGSEA
jgi:hypothetical protein